MSDLNDITDWNTQDQIVERTIVAHDGTVHVKRSQRCDRVMEGVQGAREMTRGKNVRHVASIPLVLYHKWMVEAGIMPGHPDTSRKMQEVIKKKVQSNEFWRLQVHGY